MSNVVNSDISSGTTMQFFPEASIDGAETFIWTDIYYNPISNVIAVSGCYWGCPSSVQLFTFDDPMSDKQKYIDLKCFDGDFDIYEDVDFIKWNNGNIHITRYAIESESNEEIIITQSEYLEYLVRDGQEL